MVMMSPPAGSPDEEVEMDTEYRIERQHGCIITYGSMPITTMVELMAEVGEEGQMDMALANKLGASMVLGESHALTTLAQDPTIQDQILARVKASTDSYNIPQSAIRWLEEGCRGLSSETIFVAMTGIPLIEADDLSHPHDVSDFLRCRLLLEGVPEFAARRDELKALSAYWRALVPHWDELCELIDQEAPAWRDSGGPCPKAYARIKDLYESLP
jgi:hypothetical protein